MTTNPTTPLPPAVVTDAHVSYASALVAEALGK